MKEVTKVADKLEGKVAFTTGAARGQGRSHVRTGIAHAEYQVVVEVDQLGISTTDSSPWPPRIFTGMLCIVPLGQRIGVWPGAACRFARTATHDCGANAGAGASGTAR